MTRGQVALGRRGLGRVVSLRSPKADSLDPSVRDALAATAESLAADVSTLRAQ